MTNPAIGLAFRAFLIFSSAHIYFMVTLARCVWEKGQSDLTMMGKNNFKYLPA